MAEQAPAPETQNEPVKTTSLTDYRQEMTQFNPTGVTLSADHVQRLMDASPGWPISKDHPVLWDGEAQPHGPDDTRPPAAQ